MNTDQIIEDILDAIYWVKLTRKQTQMLEIIILSNSSVSEKANEICEWLNIEKRGNRSNIKSVLLKNIQ